MRRKKKWCKSVSATKKYAQRGQGERMDEGRGTRVQSDGNQSRVGGCNKRMKMECVECVAGRE